MICLNCNEEIQEGDLFCDETCEQEYEEYLEDLLVRYAPLEEEID